MSRNVLESLIIILIALTAAMVLVLPKYQETIASLEQLEGKRTDLKNRQDYFKALAQVAAEFKNYSDNLDKVKSALPLGPMAPSLSNYLQSISSQSGLILKNLSYGMNNATVVQRDASTGFAVSDYEIGLTLSGSYSAFKEFLLRVEKSSRLIEIQGIDFTVNQSEIKVPAPAVKPADNANGTGLEAAAEEPDQMTYEFKVKLKARYY